MTHFAVRFCWVAAVGAVLLSPAAKGAYVISVVDADTGASVGFGAPGERLHLALLMTGTGEFDSFGVGIRTTGNGIHYFDYALAPGKTNQFGRPLFVTDGLNDFSYFSNPGSGYFTALTEEPNTYWTGNGHLVTFEAFVDPSVSSPGPSVIEPDVDFFSRGFDELQVSPGRPFVFWIIGAPIEPGSLILLGIGGLLLGSRARRRACAAGSGGNRRIRYKRAFAIVLWPILAGSTADAHYVISVVDAQTDVTTASAGPGDTLQLALRLTGVGGFDTFGVTVQATPDVLAYGASEIAPGFCYTDCVNYPPYFSALSEDAGQDWTDGHLVTFEVTVDHAALGSSTVLIEPVVDFFYHGFDTANVSPAPPFVLTIVPEPTALSLLVAGSVLAVARRGRSRESSRGNGIGERSEQ